jgi:hypothetical protein
MSHRSTHPRLERLRLLVVAPLIAAALLTDKGATCAGEADAGQRVLFEDAFTSKLAEGWTWVREDPKAWRVEKGELLIRSLPGGLYREMNDCKNLLLRPLPHAGDGPLIVEVTLRSQPQGQFEHAGIVWYCDDDDYVVLSKEHYTKGAEPAVQMVREQKVDGKLTSKDPHHVPFDDEQVALRLVIEGASLAGYYRRTDQQEWKAVGTIEVTSIEGKPRIGLVTSFGSAEDVRWVHFSGFRIIRRAAP